MILEWGLRVRAGANPCAHRSAQQVFNPRDFPGSRRDRFVRNSNRVNSGGALPAARPWRRSLNSEARAGIANG
jgi:hypothetical protein